MVHMERLPSWGDTVVRETDTPPGDVIPVLEWVQEVNNYKCVLLTLVTLRYLLGLAA